MFDWFSHFLHVPEEYVHIVGAGVVALTLILIALKLRGRWSRFENQLVPEEKVSLGNLFEFILEGLYSLFEGVIGHGFKKHFPILACSFVFIFLSNLSGLIPGFPSPTSNINTNLAMALCIFIYFNAMGIKEHGVVGYLKHFAGPMWYLAILIFPIEIFGTFVRPLTLSLRLYANIYADHLVVGIFSNLVHLFIPVLFMMLGVFVCFVQAFVFTLLSSIYIGLATAHEEHH